MNFLNTLLAHWQTILVVAGAVHVAASTVTSALNKPKATNTVETVWHYVQIVLGLGSNLAAQQPAAPTTTPAK